VAGQAAMAVLLEVAPIWGTPKQASASGWYTAVLVTETRET